MTNLEKVGLLMKNFGQEVKTNPALTNMKINNIFTNEVVNFIV